ncbi:MAG: diaminopimelate epimerase [Clostridia bacterium]|nr:diaminopimelate epimerase [Clostridia bacterium]
MSDRNFGIGGDGVILICSSDVAVCKMRIFNLDGSEAQMCGNGIRCVAKYIYEKDLLKDGKYEIRNMGKQTFIKFDIETMCGIKNVKLKVENKIAKLIEVKMGEPIFKAETIPVILKEGDSEESIILRYKEKEFEFCCVSMGNPHAVCIIKAISDLEFRKYAEVFERDGHFPERSNIEFVKVLDRKNISLKVWERGSGETLACGTGACAAAIVCMKKGFVDNEVNVNLKGGKLRIRWDKIDGNVYLIGGAEFVFDGVYKLLDV